MPASSESGPRFPRSILRASNAEYGPVCMNLLAGQIPADLSGHVYLVAPVGSVNSNGLPKQDNSHIWNGDGLIHRFDLDTDGGIQLTTRLARTPCYWADLATRTGTPQAKLGFSDWGMARFSPSLGMRDQPNTALVPMRFADDQATRLLLTFDGGRPFEIDPVSLAVVTPMGSNAEWQAGMPGPWPFPPVLTTAHPVFDPETATLFSINYGRSSASLLTTIPALLCLMHAIKTVAHIIRPLAFVYRRYLKPLLASLDQKIGVTDFVHLLAWDGKGPLRRWQLIHRNGDPVRIQQTMHQIGVSRDYIVLADTSLKFGLGQLLPGPLPLYPVLKRLLRGLLTGAQRSDTSVYIVRKSDLVATHNRVEVSEVTIEQETGHFLVDTENPEGRITIHVAHENATDVSEWIRSEDNSALDSSRLDPSLSGMISVGAMDVGRIGRYVIDAEAGTLVEQQSLHHKSFTWGIGLYAYRQDGRHGASPGARHTSIYWQSLGFWPELLSKFIYKLYANYPHRLVPLSELLGGPKNPESRPSTLFRVDTTSMEIVDCYPFPQQRLDDGSWQSWICGSPQFIPRCNPDSTPVAQHHDPDTDGWIFCVAVSEQSKEIWIFDAADLASGPLCRLSHPDFDPGYTVHTAWLERIEPRTAPYRIDVRHDYDPRLRQSSPAIRELFETSVYPQVDAVTQSPGSTAAAGSGGAL